MMNLLDGIHEPTATFLHDDLLRDVLATDFLRDTVVTDVLDREDADPVQVKDLLLKEVLSQGVRSADQKSVITGVAPVDQAIEDKVAKDTKVFQIRKAGKTDPISKKELKHAVKAAKVAGNKARDLIIKHGEDIMLEQ
jgi:hypothetical protein